MIRIKSVIFMTAVCFFCGTIRLFAADDSRRIPTLEEIYKTELAVSPEPVYGFNTFLRTGIGFVEDTDASVSIQAGIGYEASPDFIVNLCLGYMPYSFKLKEELIDEEFSGELFSLYVTGDFLIGKYKRFKSFFATGGGLYIYSGDVGRPADETGNSDYTVSEIRAGANASLKFQLEITENISFVLVSAYHFSKYKFGGKIVTIEPGLTYNF